MLNSKKLIITLSYSLLATLLATSFSCQKEQNDRNESAAASDQDAIGGPGEPAPGSLPQGDPREEVVDDLNNDFTNNCRSASANSPLGKTFAALTKSVGGRNCTETFNSLNQLSTLDLRGQGLSDLSPVSYFKGLTAINFSNNEINNLSALKGFDKLHSLDASNNQVSGIDSDMNWPAMSHLILAGNPFTGLDNLAHLSELQTLDLSNAGLSSAAGFTGFTKLMVLRLEGNQISSLLDLRAISSLIQLDVSSNQLSSLAGVEGLTKLDEIDFSNNQVTDISALSGITTLFFIKASGNGLTSLAAINLEKHPELNDVFASYDMQRIIREIEGICEKKIPSHTKCLLFLDEIQATPAGIAALRYFPSALMQDKE